MGNTTHEIAAEAADAGISRATVRAERGHAGWVYEAAEALGLAASSFKAGDLFTIEQLRARCAHVPPPPDLRAWGGATRVATRRGYIVRTDEVAPAASSNNSPKPLYTLGWRPCD